MISSSYPRHPGESENAGVLARDLALRYLAEGHEVRVVTPAKPGGVIFDDGLHGTVIPWLRPSLATADLEPKGPIDAIRTTTLVVSGAICSLLLALRSRPNRIIALWALPSGLFAWVIAKLLRVPYAVWALGSDIWRAHDFPAGPRLLRHILRRADGAYADGLALAAQAEKISGVPVEFLPSVRELPPANPGEIVDCDVAFVGRLHPNKGPDVLVEAMALLDARTCRMFGGGEMEDRLRANIASRGLGATVSLSGPIEAPAVAQLLRQCRVLAIPSRVESLPLILGDAIQAGTTVVTTDVGDMGDVIRRFGLGLVVPPEDPQALALAIDQLLDGRVPARRDAEAREMFAPGRSASVLAGTLHLDETMGVGR